MTPKEKAKYLIDKFYQTTPNEAWINPPLGSLSMEYKAWEQAKQCALIAVDEMINNAGFIWGGVDNETGLTARDMYRKYWHEVKQEIEKL